MHWKSYQKGLKETEAIGSENDNLEPSLLQEGPRLRKPLSGRCGVFSSLTNTDSAVLKADPKASENHFRAVRCCCTQGTGNRGTAGSQNHCPSLPPLLRFWKESFRMEVIPAPPGLRARREGRWCRVLVSKALSPGPLATIRCYLD